MAIGSGIVFKADFSEVHDALENLIDARDALNSMDTLRGVKGYTPVGTRMQQRLRREVRIMAQNYIVPAIQQKASTRFEKKIARTAVAVNDRLPVVKVGKTQPRTLSGWKYTKPADRKRMAGTLAHGAEYGPWNGSTNAGIGKRVGRYGRGRSQRGYFITPAVESAYVTRTVIQRYKGIVNMLFRIYGVDKRVGG